MKKDRTLEKAICIGFIAILGIMVIIDVIVKGSNL